MGPRVARDGMDDTHCERIANPQRVAVREYELTDASRRHRTQLEWCAPHRVDANECEIVITSVGYKFSGEGCTAQRDMDIAAGGTVCVGDDQPAAPNDTGAVAPLCANLDDAVRQALGK